MSIEIKARTPTLQITAVLMYYIYSTNVLYYSVHVETLVDWLVSSSKY
jgi:hypothetical protein